MVDVSYKGRRLTATCPKLDEAIAKRVELQHQLMNGQRAADPGAGRGWNLGVATDKCKALHWSGLRSEETAAKNIGFALQYFERERGLDTIDTNDLDEYASDLANRVKNSDSTINRKLAALSKVMTFAMERGGLDRKPKFPFRKKYAGRIRFFTEEEEDALVDAALAREWPKMADLITVLIDTGLRRSEALALTPPDFDLEQGVVNVWMTKTNRARSVPLTKRVRKIVERRLTARSLNEKLFPLTIAQIHHCWRTLRRSIGFAQDKAFVLHTCRHTCASRLIQRGVPLKVVQEWMGPHRHHDHDEVCPLGPRQSHGACVGPGEELIMQVEWSPSVDLIR